eukprot:CAMPEP_0115042952 /NCGR_PEP_ID=MMETSP0216-20121206/46573_1 /TAXON_ID=223996 /ORGANISM="Protocruzia adherens, Strain Boccale" /LENGTH=494 /DNA_ID=CAMNT_0002425167 /DNA_START=140 /DNA_END=1621 /DNA_ORIENTATION=+
MLDNFYDNKTLLVSGCTGFVGKVMLEKLLTTFPKIKKIFILVRARSDASVVERFQKDILESPCFNRLRQRQGTEFHNFVFSKVVPVHGDLLKDKLGVNPETYKLLEEEVQVIINSAASVDFLARLDHNLAINVLGPMRILELARGCKNLVIFTQISTSYVNSDKSGWIEEKIYNDFRKDPEEALTEILSIPEDKIEARQAEILGEFPNTYTYTKSLAERLLQLRRGTIPLLIARPAIIGCSHFDPEPGWTDSVDAAGALFLTAGMGLVKKAVGREDNIGDIVPADTVVDTVLVASAKYAAPNAFQVIQIGTSYLNPVRWRLCSQIVIEYWKANQTPKRVSDDLAFSMVESRKLYELQHFLKLQVPTKFYLYTAKALGNTKMIQNVERYQRLVVERSKNIVAIFEPFTTCEFIFESRRMPALYSNLTSEEKEVFKSMNVENIHWIYYLRIYSYGLKTFILKEEADRPTHSDNYDLVRRHVRTEYFSEAMWAYRTG